MVSKTNERALESSIEKRLTDTSTEELQEKGLLYASGERQKIYCSGNGFYIGLPTDFNAKYAIDESRLWHFLQRTEKEELAKLQRQSDWKLKVLDRLEITNPGKLPPELTISKLKTEHASYPANPLLAECMYQAGYFARFGTGTLEILRFAEAAHLEEPDFAVNEGFKVVLWRTGQVPGKESASTNQVPDKYWVSSGQVPGKLRMLDEKQRVVLVLKVEMKGADIQAALGLKHRDYFTTNYLQSALADVLIEMTIPSKPNSSRQRYRLTDKGIALKKSLNDDSEQNQ